MSDSNSTPGIQPIEAAEVPLSHNAGRQRSSWRNQPAIIISTTVVIGAGLVIATLAWLPALLRPAVDSQIADTTEVAQSTNLPAGSADSRPSTNPKLAPFAASQQQLARQRAEAQLKSFVERQLELEEIMTVGAWGEREFNQALDLATRGDDAFQREAFDEAITTYQQAAENLSKLINDGTARVNNAISIGNQALDARDPGAALAAFDSALTISPEHVVAKQGRLRALQLPEVIRLERLARNQELANEWQLAGGTYQEILQLDPDTSGIKAALAAVTVGAQDLKIQQLLSDAFSALEARRYTPARQAFNQVLAIAPNNGVAASGLEQIRQETELRQIDRIERAAAQAAKAEQWDRATEHYQAALKIDPNIAFAKRGLENAAAQQRITKVLDRIIANPDKLSSQTLLEDGRRLLTEAKALASQGPNIAQKIIQVDKLLASYSTPVNVVIRSDAQTQVVLSSVGELGRFTNKTLALRPGAYTLIGSRDGCRDIRETITVRPGMQPLDIRCTEALRP